MKCKKCGSSMKKNGVRNNRQRWYCKRCKKEYTIKLSNNILIIPDLHIPFEHKKALKFVSDLRREYGCSRVIQMGDVVDQYCFSRYLRNPDALITKDEVKMARKVIWEWSKEFPNLDITKGNHDVRINKRLYEIGIPSDVVLKEHNYLFGMPKGWKWHNELIINDVHYFHGGKCGPYAHINTARDFRRSTVIAHTHCTLAVDWTSGFNDRIFAVNAGCLIDQTSYAFYYAKEMTRRPILGAVVMIDGKYPLPIPMEG